ncbi:GNAT family N-acetyltransferase [Marinobacterium stanieri]|uniref:GNAT family N-acetyltransferase n=1 Tax=Marinobacterium stanieri TaxID=49186 RepID=UPI000255931D|nr:GNAT family N-acetyltransferase [Marinobacterium stanieri]
MHPVEIRNATADDASLILRFVQELATYEKEPEAVVATEADIQASIFGPESTVEAVICEVAGEPVGFAVYFYNYSTWLGRNGMYLEDLYVSPAYRKVGAGKALLKHLAGIAVSKGCGRFEWSVLDWNEPAIGFYQSLGAKPMDGWTVYRLTGAELEALARS